VTESWARQQLAAGYAGVKEVLRAASSWPTADKCYRIQCSSFEAVDRPNKHDLVNPGLDYAIAVDTCCLPRALCTTVLCTGSDLRMDSVLCAGATCTLAECCAASTPPPGPTRPGIVYPPALPAPAPGPGVDLCTEFANRGQCSTGYTLVECLDTTPGCAATEETCCAPTTVGSVVVASTTTSITWRLAGGSCPAGWTHRGYVATYFGENGDTGDALCDGPVCRAEKLEPGRNYRLVANLDCVIPDIQAHNAELTTAPLLPTVSFPALTEADFEDMTTTAATTTLGPGSSFFPWAATTDGPDLVLTATSNGQLVDPPTVEVAGTSAGARVVESVGGSGAPAVVRWRQALPHLIAGEATIQTTAAYVKEDLSHWTGAVLSLFRMRANGPLEPGRLLSAVDAALYQVPRLVLPDDLEVGQILTITNTANPDRPLLPLQNTTAAGVAYAQSAGDAMALVSVALPPVEVGQDVQISDGRQVTVAVAAAQTAGFVAAVEGAPGYGDLGFTVAVSTDGWLEVTTDQQSPVAITKDGAVLAETTLGQQVTEIKLDVGAAGTGDYTVSTTLRARGTARTAGVAGFVQAVRSAVAEPGYVGYHSLPFFVMPATDGVRLVYRSEPALAGGRAEVAGVEAVGTVDYEWPQAFAAAQPYFFADSQDPSGRTLLATYFDASEAEAAQADPPVLDLGGGNKISFVVGPQSQTVTGATTPWAATLNAAAGTTATTENPEMVATPAPLVTSAVAAGWAASTLLDGGGSDWPTVFGAAPTVPSAPFQGAVAAGRTANVTMSRIASLPPDLATQQLLRGAAYGAVCVASSLHQHRALLQPTSPGAALQLPNLPLGVSTTFILDPVVLPGVEVPVAVSIMSVTTSLAAVAVQAALSVPGEVVCLARLQAASGAAPTPETVVTQGQAADALSMAPVTIILSDLESKMAYVVYCSAVTSDTGALAPTVQQHIQL